VAVLGDLHLEGPPVGPGDLGFAEARAQVAAAVGTSSADGVDRAVVQIGDVGGYSAQPGSQACFDRAREYLDGFGLPYRLITGNHDLEGAEFDTDASNLAAWERTFGQRHFWSEDVGGVRHIGLSTTRFRDSPHSCHEVHVDAAQLRWFEETLAATPPGRPVFVFTHAPPLGSGLKVLDEVHVKNGCAWLNHSGEDPGVFLDIVKRHPQIRLWFSGHFHLSHDYPDSVSVRHGCAFVQLGVISEKSQRDGRRQSRLVRGDSSSCQLLTLDHGTGTLRVDMEVDLSSVPGWKTPQPLAGSALEQLPCNSDLWLCAVDPESFDACTSVAGGVPAEGSSVTWSHPGGPSTLGSQGNLLVEYDTATGGAIGVVSDDLRGRRVLLDFDEEDFEGDAEASAVLLVSEGGEVERVERGAGGYFKRVFQKNKWHAGRVEGSAPWLAKRGWERAAGPVLATADAGAGPP